MTAQIIPLRRSRKRVSAGPCGSGTIPGQITAPCGRTDTVPTARGACCPDHMPPSKAQLLATPLLPVWDGTRSAS